LLRKLRKIFFSSDSLVYAELLLPNGSNIQTGAGTAMSYANLIFKRIPFAALISDRGDWSSPLGWEKKIFGWIAVRRAIPAEQGEHIRMPYSAAKIVSISPGAMPPFTLETHTINAKLNLPSV
jgi:hypothetical protein